MDKVQKQIPVIQHHRQKHLEMNYVRFVSQIAVDESFRYSPVSLSVSSSKLQSLPSKLPAVLVCSFCKLIIPM
jgi:hypothetical protein